LKGLSVEFKRSAIGVPSTGSGQALRLRSLQNTKTASLRMTICGQSEQHSG
jgi:hypothetical protein